MKYTPGPWTDPRVYKDPHGEAYCIAIYGNGTIVHSHRVSGNKEQVEANARLISATPDLLEAAIDIIRIIEAGISTQSIYDTKGGTLDALRDAVKKARGDL